ncbi:MAG: MFS transporter, partial [bacterium]
MNIRILVFLSIANIVATLGQGLVVPLLPGYAHDLGASGFMIGLIFGVFSVSRSVLLPYFGWLSDIKGRKMFITAGLFFYFLTSIAYYYSQHVHALILI